MPCRNPEAPVRLTRRAACLLGLGLLTGCGGDDRWHGVNVTGSSPSLDFRMTRAGDGQEVTAADYRGKAVMLYFGYTFCPDVCPMTLANIAAALDALGPDARQVKVLFITVDPNRDTAEVLAEYARNFSPQVDGLRGTEDQITALARRYRIAYSVTPGTKDQPYEVTHSSAVYAFDGTGAARLLFASLGSASPDTDGTAADMKRLVAEEAPAGLVDRLLRMV
jgi:protein SCO1/2